MKKRVYTKEFKLSVLDELQTKTAAQICRERNINSSVIQRWKNEYKANPEKAFSGNGNLWKENAEIAKKDRLIGQLYAENDFLKKTLETLQKLRAEEKRKWLK